jgi:hypothetical protein
VSLAAAAVHATASANFSDGECLSSAIRPHGLRQKSRIATSRSRCFPCSGSRVRVSSPAPYLSFRRPALTRVLSLPRR